MYKGIGIFHPLPKMGISQLCIIYLTVWNSPLQCNNTALHYHLFRYRWQVL